MLNKRIFELIQAQNGFRGLLWTEEDKQEFAELIVRECAHYVEYQLQIGGHKAEMIKQHFGVK